MLRPRRRRLTTLRLALAGVTIIVLLTGVTVAGCAMQGTGGAPSGPVLVTLDKQQYATNDTITVTITNTLTSAITVEDHQTNCSIVSLQLLSDSAWQTIHNCHIMTPTRLISLAAGSVTTVRLIPGGGQIVTTPWAAGSYRVLLTYGASATATPSSSAQATSVTFTVA